MPRSSEFEGRTTAAADPVALAEDEPELGANPAAELWQRQFASGCCDVHPSDWPALRTFGQLAPKLVRQGYHPIPISLPSDGGNSPGKRPAMKRGWQQGCPKCDWPRYAANGVGILARDTPAVDIDVIDPDLSAAIGGVATTLLGQTLERVGRPPKRLLPFRLEGEPFRKRELGFDGGQIEVLSNGQQWLVAGIHPETERPYRWTGLSCELWNTPHARLPPLSPEGSVRFLKALAKWLTARGVQNVEARKGFTLAPRVTRPHPPPLRARHPSGHAETPFEVAMRCGVAAVQSASEGGRNATLYDEALKLSRFVRQRKISAAELEAELLAASSLSPREAAGTVASAFRIGLAS